MKRILLIIPCAVLISLLGISVAQANDPFGLSGLQSAINRATQSAAQSAALIALQNKCNAIRNKMISGSYMIHSYGVGPYGNFTGVSAKLDQIISQAGDKGYDVNQLKADTSAFKDLVSDYNSKYSYAYVMLSDGAALHYLQCSSSDPAAVINEMKSYAVNARTGMQSARDLINQIKQQYRDKIKPDLFTLSQQKYIQQ